ncbi:MAG: hypothetical protein VYC39_00780 [Myxococcota bacterium]|nr:hypothetical protein [Myxococcota bacterium]
MGTKVSQHCVFLCTGSDCIKNKKRFKTLKQTISSEANVQTVKCQKICHGPVAGTFVDGKLTWFEKVDSAKQREALLHLLQTGRITKPLTKRVYKKRSGKLR